MITGRMRAPDAAPPPRIAGWWRAAWLLGCAAVAAGVLANYL
jgi:hypothetical protein